MKQRIICKALAVAVIILFLGLAIQPSVATVQPETEIDIEPKEYLFQTIIEIANNPDVNSLLEQHRNDLFKVDIDRSIYRKLFLRNPRLLLNMLFTKPSITCEYLDKCYNNGIEITNIIGEDKALELIESIKVTDIEVFDELNEIVLNNEELSDRLVVLEEMNKGYVSDLTWEFPVICNILAIILVVLFIPVLFCLSLMEKVHGDLKSIINSIMMTYLFVVFGIPFLLYFGVFKCDEFLPWY